MQKKSLSELLDEMNRNLARSKRYVDNTRLILNRSTPPACEGPATYSTLDELMAGN